MPTLARLSVTPVKGTAIHHPSSATITPAGIPQDRRFYIVDEWGELFSGGTFGPLVAIVAEYDTEAERLKLRFPDGSRIEAPADELGAEETTDFYGRAWPRTSSRDRSPRRSRCTAPAPAAGADAIARGTVPTWSRSRSSRPSPCATSPSEAGTEGTLDARRFRLNLELEGCDPYEEDSWAGRRNGVGGARSRSAARCRDAYSPPRILTPARRTGTRSPRSRGTDSASLATAAFRSASMPVSWNPVPVRVGDVTPLDLDL